ncbi:ribonuclease D [Escherichia coli]|uniref:Ribonuclease D n=1 Tax=Escherichia coli TaxID=562 RepID=A0A377BD47_ECOLX|nr:ribonuclease D [Escherichia coli]
MITTDDALASLCEAVRAFPAIALDTEFVRTRTYYPQLGLIQLFDGEHLALSIPLGITDWSPLKAILRDPSITNFSMQAVKIWKCSSMSLAITTTPD